MWQNGWGYGPWMMGGGFMIMMGIMFIFCLTFMFIFRRNGMNCVGFRRHGYDWSGMRHLENPHNHAIQILMERYAKGEIDTEEYHKRKKELQ